MEADKQQVQRIPAPPMLDFMIEQLDGAMGTIAAPDYVKTATENFIASLKKWQKESGTDA